MVTTSAALPGRECVKRTPKRATNWLLPLPRYQIGSALIKRTPKRALIWLLPNWLKRLSRTHIPLHVIWRRVWHFRQNYGNGCCIIEEERAFAGREARYCRVISHGKTRDLNAASLTKTGIDP